MAEKKKREIPEYLAPYFSRKTQLKYYLDYKKHAKQIRDIDNKFICLKGFSSSTPFYRASSFNSTSLGGGFFFCWHGLGIAVDPGIGFMTQMHEYGILIDDIDVVIVTHAHIDHNQDVRGIASLLYEYNKGRERNAKFYNTLLPNTVLTNNHSIHWVLDSSTYQQVKEDIGGQKVTLLKSIIESKSTVKLSDDTELIPFITEHIEGDSFGIKLVFKDSEKEHIWGYTSDTKYFTGLLDSLSDCEIIIMNISDVYYQDVEGVKAKNGHLGFDGCMQLLENLDPSIALISEFTCMNGDYRFETIKGLCDNTKDKNVRIMPADVGLSLSINGETVRCSYCGHFHSVSETRVIRPTEYYSQIGYVCQKCMI